MLIQLATVIKWEKREHSNKCVFVSRAMVGDGFVWFIQSFVRWYDIDL